jgi:rhodanese-related sulfurtransferase
VIAAPFVLALALASVAGSDACVQENTCRPTDAASSSPWISASELLRLKTSTPQLKIVDVRAATAFEAYHIPGALSLTPLEIKAKRIWHEDPIVLVGSGAAYGALQQLREELIEVGFRDVAVLDGGTAYWHDTVEQKKEARPRMIEPTGFDLVRDRARWVILDFAAAPPQVLPAAQRIALGVSTPADAARASDGSLAGASRDIRNVLLVADEESDASAIALALGPVQRHNVFVLRGGWVAWDRQQRIAQTLALREGDDALEAQCW